MVVLNKSEISKNSAIVNLPDNISYFQITRIFLEPFKLWLSLDVINPIDREECYSLEFRELAYLSIIKTPEDDAGVYIIGDINLTLVNDISSLLNFLGENTFLQNSNCKNNFYHLHIEGDVCIDVISNLYNIKKI